MNARISNLFFTGAEPEPAPKGRVKTRREPKE